MTLTQLKREAAHLLPAEQRELIAFLIARQTEQTEDFRRELAQKIDNNDPANWVELDDLRRRYRE